MTHRNNQGLVASTANGGMQQNSYELVVHELLLTGVSQKPTPHQLFNTNNMSNTLEKFVPTFDGSNFLEWKPQMQA